jgi:hypothetical protein
MNSNRHERDSSQEENALTSPPLSQYSDSSKLAATDPGIASHTDNIKDRNSRREFRWSKSARDLVRANMNASGSEVSLLISRLVAESGKHIPELALLFYADSPVSGPNASS